MAANANETNRKMLKWTGNGYSQENGWTLADLVRSAGITRSGGKHPIDSHIIFTPENNSNGCKAKWQESWAEYKEQQKTKRLSKSHYTHFSPAPMNLEELCETLNSIKGLEKRFFLHNQPPCIIYKPVNEAQAEKFISLLQECSVQAKKGKSRDGSALVVVNGVENATHFLNSRVELANFAKQNNSSAIRRLAR